MAALPKRIQKKLDNSVPAVFGDTFKIDDIERNVKQLKKVLPNFDKAITRAISNAVEIATQNALNRLDQVKNQRKEKNEPPLSSVEASKLYKDFYEVEKKKISEVTKDVIDPFFTLQSDKFITEIKNVAPTVRQIFDDYIKRKAANDSRPTKAANESFKDQLLGREDKESSLLDDAKNLLLNKNKQEGKTSFPTNNRHIHKEIQKNFDEFKFQLDDVGNLLELTEEEKTEQELLEEIKQLMEKISGYNNTGLQVPQQLVYALDNKQNDLKEFLKELEEKRSKKEISREEKEYKQRKKEERAEALEQAEKSWNKTGIGKWLEARDKAKEKQEEEKQKRLERIMLGEEKEGFFEKTLRKYQAGKEDIGELINRVRKKWSRFGGIKGPSLGGIASIGLALLMLPSMIKGIWKGFKDMVNVDKIIEDIFNGTIPGKIVDQIIKVIKAILPSEEAFGKKAEEMGLSKTIKSSSTDRAASIESARMTLESNQKLSATQVENLIKSGASPQDVGYERWNQIPLAAGDDDKSKVSKAAQEYIASTKSETPPAAEGTVATKKTEVEPVFKGGSGGGGSSSTVATDVLEEPKPPPGSDPKQPQIQTSQPPSIESIPTHFTFDESLLFALVKR